MGDSLSLAAMESYLYSYLQLKRRVVGVKLYEDREAFEALDLPVREGSSYYCQMIKMASAGKLLKADNRNFACDTSARIMNLRPYYEDEEDIKGWEDSGLCGGREQAVGQHEHVRPVHRQNKGIVVGPLTMLPHEPDVVLIACNPYEAMRFLQGYAYHYGFKKDIKMSGQCGVCFESTALPLNDGDISVSLLCSGTRHVCKWSDNTMMVAFPYAMAGGIIDGIARSAEACEPDERKDKIRQQLLKHQLEPIVPLVDGGAYYLSEP